MLAKAANFAVDGIVLDLEDAVAPNAKEQAREFIIHALNTLEWQAKVVCVRVNGTNTPWCHDDVVQLLTRAGDKISTLVLAKTN